LALILLCRTFRYVIPNLCWYSRTIPVIVVISWLKFKFLEDFSKNFQISCLVEILPVWTNLFHGREGQVNRQKWWN
jgi:hypothetical protein